MSNEFRDVIEPANSNKSEEPRPVRPIPQRKIKEPSNFDVKSLFEDGGALEEVGKNINPELKEQVLVPLSNLVEKYGIGDEITSSPTAQNAGNLLSLLVDVAPVIKGLSDYVSGKKNSLAAEDKKFLEEIMSSQGDGDFSELFIGEETTPEPTVEKDPLFDLDKGPLDWERIMDPEGIHFKKTQQTVPDLEFKSKESTKLRSNFFADAPKVSPFQSLEELAAEAGMAMDKVKSEDSHNSNTNDSSTFEYTSEETVDLISQDLNNEIMDSLLDVEDDEIVYLDDSELAELKQNGFVFEEVADLNDDLSIDEEEWLLGGIMANPVWKVFVNKQMPIWLEWFANIHLKSYLEMCERFILAYPYYVPKKDSEIDDKGLFEKLMINEEFIDSLSDKGVFVWYNSDFYDFIDELTPYCEELDEINKIRSFFIKYDWWFNRLYKYLRNELLDYYHSQGRSFVL